MRSPRRREVVTALDARPEREWGDERTPRRRAGGIFAPTVVFNNPFTIVTNACRALYNGLPVGNGFWVSIAWSVGTVVLFAGLSIRQFSRSTVA